MTQNTLQPSKLKYHEISSLDEEINPEFEQIGKQSANHFSAFKYQFN